MKRCGVVFFVAVLVFCMVFPAFAAITEGVIKIAHTEKANDLFEDHYLAMTTVFKNVMEQDTQGRFKVSVFPNGQLGDNPSMLEQCQRGLIQITCSQSVGLLGTYNPKFNLFEIPFVFENTEHISEMYNTDFTRALIEETAKSKGIRLTGIMPAGMRCFTNNVRPIVTPKDMVGLKIRSMEIPVYMKMIQALGASPTPIPWSELYTACQTGIVDGQENAPQSLILLGLENVQKYLTLDNHTGNIVTFNVNEKFYQSLTDEDRKVFNRAVREGIRSFMGILKAKEARDLEYLTKKMEITYLTPAQREEFKKVATPPVIEYMIKELGKEVTSEFLKAAEEVKENI
ncbi:DctP family TRAP transporter solute-binding subunit [Acetomicrobium mobile]|uniref:DctP family TRAP transporter solute-binding subunit n=1 Tax=Acetomicrobium mobile TaxID=97477 RepID=UPI0026F16EAF|nr:DctP family TRAP transporter solute-binding subunit [Acetomicrobium mobile]